MHIAHHFCKTPCQSKLVWHRNVCLLFVQESVKRAALIHKNRNILLIYKESDRCDNLRSVHSDNAIKLSHSLLRYIGSKAIKFDESSHSIFTLEERLINLT